MAHLITKPSETPAQFLEQHYMLPELAKRWGISYKTALAWFGDRPDVIRFGSEHRASKRRHVSVRVPESVAQKVYEEHLGNGALKR